jgi:hypothetical protein
VVNFGFHAASFYTGRHAHQIKPWLNIKPHSIIIALVENKPQVRKLSSYIRKTAAKVAGIAVVSAAGLCAFLGFILTPGVQAGPLLQHPTVSMPTVTGPPRGPFITVPMDQKLVYVRSGPGRSFPVIGILVTGEIAPALATSAQGEWVQVTYLGVEGSIGWVFARLVTITDVDDLSEVAPPPTPTPNATPTLPSGAERFAAPDEPTRLPTYTPAAPVVQPTFGVVVQQTPTGALPIGFIIIGLAVLGGFGILLSILRGR